VLLKPCSDVDWRRPVRLAWSASLWIVLLAAGAVSVRAQPAQILLLRHGEKPDDKAAVHLSVRGEDRAEALAKLFGLRSSWTSNAPVAALFASRVTRHDHSHRTGETLGPLSHALGLPIQTPFDSDDYRPLARQILANRSYQGKTVVICWTHHNMAELASALGVHPQPEPWKEKVFDRFWQLRFAEGRVKWREVPERLLPGDSKRG
jgi:hypothetical protein